MSRFLVLLALTVPAVATSQARQVPCDPDNAGITVPAGFCVSRYADSLQLPRHMVVAPNGDLLIVGNARGGR